MADGGMMDMSGLGSLMGGGKGGDGGGGGTADSSGLGADGAGMSDGGMGDAGGMSADAAGAPGSAAMAMQSNPTVQAAAQGDPTGAAGAAQAVSGGTPAPPGTAGGVGGVQSAPQPPPGGTIAQATPTPTVPATPSPGGSNAIPGSWPTGPQDPNFAPGSGQTVPGPTGFTPAQQDGAGTTEPNIGTTESNAAGKGDLQTSMPDRFAGAFRPFGLQQLAEQMPTSFADRFSAADDAGGMSGGEAPAWANPGSMGGVGDTTTASGNFVDAPSWISSVVNEPGNQLGSIFGGGPGDVSSITQVSPSQDPTAGGAGPGGQVPPTQGAAPTGTPPAGDGTKPATGDGTKPATAPATKPAAASAAAPGGGQAPGTMQGQIDPLKIIQALLRGGPMGALSELAREVMGGSPMGGPNNAPWAPGYGPNNSYRNPQTDAQYGPRDRFGRPIGKGVPPNVSANPPPAVTTNPPGTPKPTIPTPPTAGAVPPDTAPRPAQTASAQPGLGAAATPLTAGNGPNQVAYVSRRFPLQGGVHQTQPTVERAWTNDEITRNPTVDGVPLDQKMFQMVTGEVGRNASNQAKIVQLETAFNRAQMRGHSISQALWGTQRGHINAAGKDTGYYPPTTMNARNLPASQQELDDFKQNVLAPVLNGSNLSDIGYGPMTGNASSDLAARQLGKMPGYKMRGGDTYFREGPLKALPPIGGPQSSTESRTQMAFAGPRPVPLENLPMGRDEPDIYGPDVKPPIGGYDLPFGKSPEDMPPNTFDQPQTLPRGMPKPTPPTAPYPVPTGPDNPIPPRNYQVGWAGPEDGYYG